MSKKIKLTEKAIWLRKQIIDVDKPIKAMIEKSLEGVGEATHVIVDPLIFPCKNTFEKLLNKETSLLKQYQEEFKKNHRI